MQSSVPCMCYRGGAETCTAWPGCVADKQVHAACCVLRIKTGPLLQACWHSLCSGSDGVPFVRIALVPTAYRVRTDGWVRCKGSQQLRP